MCPKSYVVGLLTGTIVVLVAALVSTFAFCNCCCESSKCCVPPGCCSQECHDKCCEQHERRLEKLERKVFNTGSSEE